MAYLADGETKELLTDGFRGNFRFGRTTSVEGCSFAEGVLPNPADSCGAVENVFVHNMGLTWDESAALMGVHTLGRAELKNSGYDGWWTTPELSRRFGNSYYINIFAAGWCPEHNVNQCSDEGEAAGECKKKHQWKRCDVPREGHDQSHEMMLNTDLCLAYSDGAGGDGILRAEEDNCCAWVHSNVAEDSKINPGNFNMSAIIAQNENFFCNRECGSKLPGGGFFQCGRDNTFQTFRETEACCALAEDSPDCRTKGLGDAKGPGGPAEEAMRRFAEDEIYWASIFLTSWNKATENGFEDSLRSLGDCFS